jgi:pimeloyl-ACP methyl ester carboxylesterase
MIPTFIFQVWILGLFSVGLIGGMIYLAHEWQQRSWEWDTTRMELVFAPNFGRNEETMLLAAALILLLVALFGGSIVKAVLRLTSGSKPNDDPRIETKPAKVQRLGRPDGSELEVQFYGAEDGIPIVLTHGWGLHGKEWNYLKRELSDRFRLVVWDEPGLGNSTRPTTRDYSVDNLARDLDAVLAVAGNKPAILLGHSIGGMIILTFCRLFPEALGTRVKGLVLTHTTPMNPVRTTSGAAFFTAIERPVLVPLMYLTIALSPLLWVMSWLSYRNGSAHLSNKFSSFAGTETWEQIEFATGFQPEASPAVLARGMLGMMRYDATKTLAGINIPTLVVAGDLDSTTKPEASEHILAGIPQARMLKLTPAKHLGLLEHHEKYAAAVREFAHAVQAQTHAIAT